MLNDKVKQVLSILIGIATSVVIVVLIESLGHAIYPQPSDLDFSNQAQLSHYIKNLPLGAFFMVLFSWMLGVFFGGCVACYLNKRKFLLCNAIVASFVLLAAVANLIIIPHPIWFSLITLLVLPATALITLMFCRKNFA